MVAAVTVLVAAGALTAWIPSEPELGGSTLQLVDLARRASAGAIVAFVAVFVVGLSSVYGLALGFIRATTGGLRLAVLCHVATNATIAALVVFFLLPG